MKGLFKNLYQPKFLLLIIILQTLTLIGVYISSQLTPDSSTTQVLAQTTADFDEDIKSCLKLPVSERPICAKMIGVKLANTQVDMTEKVRQCMKLRPIFVRYCLSELRLSLLNAQPATGEPVLLSPTPEPEPEPTATITTPSESPTP